MKLTKHSEIKENRIYLYYRCVARYKELIIFSLTKPCKCRSRFDRYALDTKFWMGKMQGYQRNGGYSYTRCDPIDLTLNRIMGLGVGDMVYELDKDEIDFVYMGVL